jgi:hypothetical protein
MEFQFPISKERATDGFGRISLYFSTLVDACPARNDVAAVRFLPGGKICRLYLFQARLIASRRYGLY